MRGLIALSLLALPLAGTHAAPLPAGPAAKVSSVTLARTGLGVRGVSMRFGTTRAKAVQMVGAVLGAATKAGVYPDCGSGHAIGYARFRGGIELSFVGGKFVGWTLAAGGDRKVTTANGVGIGVSVKTLRILSPDVFIDPGNAEDGGIGANFQSETGVNGFLDGDRVTSKVTSIYAGETCIAA